MNLKQEITTLLNNLLEEEYFLVDLRFVDKKPQSKLTVLLDGDKGISIDKCAEISRSIASHVEEFNLIEDSYVLEVSSPGVDKPLEIKRQYTKNVGRNIRLVLKDGTICTGLLQQVTDDHILIQEENKKKETILSIPFIKIDKANILVSFK